MAFLSPASTRTNRRRSAVVVAVIFALAIGAYGVSCFASAQTPSVYAVVHASDGSQTRLALDRDDTVTISTDKGTNVVEVSGGQVRVVQADCPNRDCIQQGAVSGSNQQIVCLPHELWIEVVGSSDAGMSSAGLFDAVTR